MNKYLEALERLAMSDDLHIKECERLGIGLTEDFYTVEQELQRLEAIDNANPSEALECLRNLEDNIIIVENTDEAYKNVTTIKQALLKAQEPKKYLKWEDLEFSFKEKCMKVKLNENIYTLRYTRNALMEFSVAYLEFDNTEITIIDCKKQFFNDLHLEVVEE